jgi:hypothetical protein
MGALLLVLSATAELYGWLREYLLSAAGTHLRAATPGCA